jgi:hypothetical protein
LLGLDNVVVVITDDAILRAAKAATGRAGSERSATSRRR